MLTCAVRVLSIHSKIWGMSWVNLSPVAAYQADISTRPVAGGGKTQRLARHNALATALDPTRMDATVLVYRRQGFFVWEKLNNTHECTPGNNSASACQMASDVVGIELALTHVNSSTHGVPFIKDQKAPNGNPLYGGPQVYEARRRSTRAAPLGSLHEGRSTGGSLIFLILTCAQY